MSEQTGWTEDETQPPHRVLGTSLGSLRPGSIVPAVVNGQEVVAFAGGDRESPAVRFIDLDSGAPLPDRSLPHGDDTPMPGSLMAAVTDGGFRVWDPATGTEILRRDGQYDRETAAKTVAVTAVGLREIDGSTLLATGGADRSVRLWDVSTGEAIGTPWHGHTGPITAVAVTRWRDRPVVLSTEAWGPARMWLLDAPVRGAGHTGPVLAVAGGMRSGRPVFASGGEDATIRFWDPGTGTGVGEPIRSGPVAGLVFAGDVLISSGGGVVQRWDPASGEPVGPPLNRSESESGRLAVTELDGRPLVASVAGEQLRGWDAATGAPHTTMPLPGPAELQDIAVHDGRLVALTVGAPDEDLFPDTGEMDEQQITIWDVPAAAPLFPPTLTSDDGGHGAFGLAGGRLTAAHGVDALKNEENGEGVWPEEAGDIYLRDLTTGELGPRHRPEAGFNQQLVFARARGRDLVLIAADNAVVVWDTATGHEAADRVSGLSGSITCVAVIETGGRTYGAAGDWSGGVRSWEIVPR